MTNIPRQKLLVNNEWKFRHGNYDAAAFDFDDSAWSDIGLPHSFGIPYFGEGNEFYVGYGCYRKHLNIDSAWLGKRISLEFQGAFQVTEVYLNGKLAGVHKGGYTAFIFDITDLVHEGDNMLFIRVNNLWDAKIAPRAGEHNFNGGIYRDVSLVITEPVHIDWYGTFVKTPEITADYAETDIETDIVNDLDKPVEIELRSDIYYSDILVTSDITRLTLEPNSTEKVKQYCRIDYHQLWCPESPKMYRLESTVLTDGAVSDSFTTDFGIRYFKFTSDEGFFLNGEHYDIHGANVHQDHAGWSDAVTHTGIERDVAYVKDCGLNFIRGSHYPHHTYFAEQCDRQGLLFWSENCFWGTGGPNEDGFWTASGYPIHEEDEAEFEKSCMDTLTDMIRTNRNHPSIIVWSMCNEPFFSEWYVYDKAKDLLRKLVDLTHQLDPTRVAAVGGVQRGDFDVIGDLAGYNGDGASIFIDPGRPNFVSEYGSRVEDRPGVYAHRYLDNVENHYAWRSGKALWCAFHHGSILYDMGHMGMIDYYRLPLNTWHWYRKELLGIEPPKTPEKGIASKLVILSPTKTMSSDGTEDAHVIVYLANDKDERVDSEATVTLEVISGGGTFPTGKTFVLSPENKNFYEGLGAIEIRSYFAGDTVIKASCDSMESVYLTIHVTGETQWDNRPLVPMSPPPYTIGNHNENREYNIALNHPVFCSNPSNGSQINITDGNDSTVWKSSEDICGEWIMVDLEGCNKFKRINVLFDGIATDVSVAVSADRENEQIVFTSNAGQLLRELNIAGDFYSRYIKIIFNGKSADVVGVKAFDSVM